MNSIKSFMTKVSDKVREVTPSSGPTSLNIDESGKFGSPVEGFLCPTCFLNFITAEQLQKHYEDDHLEPSANYLCPVCTARLNSQVDLQAHYEANHAIKDEAQQQSVEELREEMMELSTRLREESWHSEELKKEVERLQAAFDKKDLDGEEFVSKSQLDVVEEARRLLSSEIILLRKQLTESLDQMSLLRVEKDSLEARVSDYAVERAELRATLDTLQAEKVTLESELDNFRSSEVHQDEAESVELQKLKQELQLSLGIRNSQESEIQALRERELALQNDLCKKAEVTAGLQQDMKGLKEEVDFLKKKLQDSCIENSNLSNKLNGKTKECDAVCQEVQELHQKCTSYSASIVALEDQIHKITTKASSYLSEAEKLKDDKEHLVQQLRDIEDQKNETLRELSEKTGEVESLKERINDASKEESEVLQRKSQQLEELRHSIRDLEHSLMTAESALAEKARVIEELKDQLTNSSNSLKDANSKTALWETKVKERDKIVMCLQGQIKELEPLRDELKKQEVITASQAEELRAMMDKLSVAEGKVSALSDALHKSDESLKNLHASSNNAKNEILVLTESLEKKCQSHDALSELLKNRTCENEELSCNLSKNVAALADAQKSVSELQSSKVALEETLVASQSSLDDIRSKYKDLSTQYSAAGQQLTALKAANAELLDKLNQNEAAFSQQISFLQGDNKELLSSKTALQEQVRLMGEELSALLDKSQKQSCEISELMDKLKDMSLLQEERESIQVEKDALQASLDATSSQLQMEVQCRAELEKQTESSLATQREKLQLIQAELMGREKSLADLSAELKEMEQKHENELSLFQTNYEKEQERADDLEACLVAIRTNVSRLEDDKLQLQAQVESFSDEKNGLIERCLSAEGQGERVQQQLTQLRRKLDDSTAALQELGRENQNLQMETAKLAGRKWANDSEVVECHTCQKAFTLTVRKHHCRNCGQIFCHECSSKTAPLDLNKKPVRVCDSCHVELGLKT